MQALPPNNKLKRSAFGFTLAKLLIALAILGVIATFTIPKVLQAQQNARDMATGKEAVTTISGAFSNYKLQNTLSSSTKAQDLTPYMNYVAVQTVGAIDHFPGAGTLTCSSAFPCLKLHNGGVLAYDASNNYCGTSTTDFVLFMFDPDGTVTTGAAGKAIAVDIFANGHIASGAVRRVSDETCYGGAPVTYGSWTDPSWFSW